MYFKRLEIHGFKSFAEPVVIEFDRGITCVVGPNGSGKSNICDALRWVLGEQSSKALRGDSMEDVIFAGTASRRSRGMAEVTLVIDNSDGAMRIDYNEVAITRRMYRSGESEYLINNNRCRMKDIRELIMDTGIGVEGYSIIGQGKISDIISNNTDSIREILEETAGIASYRSRKAAAERKLGSARNNMDRVNDIIGEIESRIGGLRSDSEKAKEYLELRDRHRELEINITLRNIEKIESQRKEVAGDIEQLAEQESEGEGRRGELGALIEEDTEKRDTLTDELERLRGRQADLSGRIIKLDNEGELYGERMASADRDIERLEREISEFKDKAKREKENSQSLFNTKETADAKLAEMEAALKEKTDRYEALDKKLGEIREKIDAGTDRIAELQGGINANGMELAGIRNMQDSLRERLERARDEKQRGDSENARAEDDLERAKRKRAEIKSNLTAAESVRDSLNDTYAEHYERERELVEEISSLSFEIGRLSSRRKTIEEMESNYEGYRQGVRFVMKSGMPGIAGTVAELIDVPEGREVAIETALGQTLQNVICDTTETAKRAIEKLKENRAGRVTFLPVDSVRARRRQADDAIRSEDGFLGFGPEIVKFDPEYSEIADYLLGGAAVVTDMDAAVRLSKKYRGGLRFVTLDGEIINAGGAVTGGRYRNRTAAFLERKAEVAALARRLEEAREESEAKRREKDEISDALAKESAQIEEKREEIRKIERDYFAQDNAVAVIEGALSDHQENTGRLQREIESIDEEKSESAGRMKELSEKDDEMRAEKDRIEQEVARLTEDVEAGSGELRVLGDEITQDRIELGAFESEKNSIDVVVEKTKETLDGYERDIEARGSELEMRKAEKKTLEENFAGGSGEAERLREEKKTVDEEIESKAGEKAVVTQRLSENTAEKRELDDKYESVRDQKYQLEIRQTRYDTQLENAKTKLWDDFEISYMEALDLKDEEIKISSAVTENREIKRRLRELGDVNVGSIEEYERVSERYGFLTTQRADIQKSTEELEKIISDMDRIIKAKFKASFDSVTDNFEEVFRTLYGGGHAKITLADESDPFNSEIEITAQPPGKQLKHINLLSGGEKTMTAIALMFAVLKTKPTPFCILDEIEAALDDQNLEIFGNYVREFEGVQFTLITHQKATMEHADTLYGITMPESGVSKVYSLKMEDARREDTPA